MDTAKSLAAAWIAALWLPVALLPAFAQNSGLIGSTEASPPAPADESGPSGEISRQIERISVSSSQKGGNRDSYASGPPSGDSRFVAFTSYADNLVPADTNLHADVFVRDRWAGTTIRVNVSSLGVQANNESRDAVISEDGRFVAFTSYASNLVPNDTNWFSDIFVRDLLKRTTERVSVASNGTQSRGDSGLPSISADGRFVAFQSVGNVAGGTDANGPHSDVFLRDRLAGTTTLISAAAGGGQGNGRSEEPRMSSNGRFVVFASSSSNLVAGDTNEMNDIFLRDRSTGVTELISKVSERHLYTDGSHNPSVNDDGNLIAFNLSYNRGYDTEVLVYDRNRRAISMALPSRRSVYGHSISGDGRFVTGVGDRPNDYGGIGHAQSLPGYPPLWNVLVHDRRTGKIEVLVASDDTTYHRRPSISRNGRFVTFFSNSDDLVPGDTNGSVDVFIVDRGPIEVLAFAGFRPPLAVLPLSNTVTAGTNVQINWQITREDGSFANELALVKTLEIAPIECNARYFHYGNPTPAKAAGAGLRYIETSNEFSFVWRTEITMANTCKVLILTLADDQQQYLRFGLTR